MWQIESNLVVFTAFCLSTRRLKLHHALYIIFLLLLLQFCNIIVKCFAKYAMCFTKSMAIIAGVAELADALDLGSNVASGKYRMIETM